MEFQSGKKSLAALSSITLHVPEGEFLAVTGASGSGKTTLLTLIAGMDRPTTGEVFLNGSSLSGLNEEKTAFLRGRLIGFIFQSYQLMQTMTALENVMLPLELMGEKGAKKRALDLLFEVGLSERLTHYPSQLSGGEQQRVAVARAFSCSPPVILADEPTGNLDAVTAQKVIDLILRMRTVHKTTMLLVTHDESLAGLADRVITLQAGEITSDEIGRGARK